ncbi:hypothetical protein ACLOJK_024439 [Asimina triloba]
MPNYEQDEAVGRSRWPNATSEKTNSRAPLDYFYAAVAVRISAIRRTEGERGAGGGIEGGDGGARCSDSQGIEVSALLTVSVVLECEISAVSLLGGVG